VIYFIILDYSNVRKNKINQKTLISHQVKTNKCLIISCKAHFSKNKIHMLMIHWLTSTNLLGLYAFFFFWIYMYSL